MNPEFQKEKLLLPDRVRHQINSHKLLNIPLLIGSSGIKYYK
jgi:hypothetical protein